MDLTVRAVTSDEVLAFRRRIARGFGSDVKTEDSTRFVETVDITRTIAAFDGPEIVGTGGAVTVDVTVPGGVLPMGGTTIITVLPTHRRRGVLTAMMRAHFAEIRDRGEPLAGLWASESSIYGRFGYGRSAEAYEMKVDGRTIEFTADPPPGVVRMLEPDAAEAPIRAVYERVRPRRPGMLSRFDAWWKHQILADPEWDRDGASQKRFVVYRDGASVDGYAIYRQAEKWDDFPDGTVKVVELVAATPNAHHALWRYLTRIDLYPNVSYWNLPVDDPLPWRVDAPRRVRRSLTDSLWLRVMDIPRALSGRAYGDAGRLVFAVRDPFLPENDGHYALDARSSGAECNRTDSPADIEINADGLAAVYAGAHRITALAAGGLARGDADALALADRLFAWPVAPWCPEIF